MFLLLGVRLEGFERGCFYYGSFGRHSFDDLVFFYGFQTLAGLSMALESHHAFQATFPLTLRVLSL